MGMIFIASWTCVYRRYVGQTTRYVTYNLLYKIYSTYNLLYKRDRLPGTSQTSQRREENEQHAVCCVCYVLCAVYCVCCVLCVLCAACRVVCRACCVVLHANTGVTLLLPLLLPLSFYQRLLYALKLRLVAIDQVEMNEGELDHQRKVRK